MDGKLKRNMTCSPKEKKSRKRKSGTLGRGVMLHAPIEIFAYKNFHTSWNKVGILFLFLWQVYHSCYELQIYVTKIHHIWPT